MKLTYFTDPAHGWLEVPVELLVKLDIHHDISEYSYLHGGMAYLEEDSDMTIFLRKYAEYNRINGLQEEYAESYSEHSIIRSFEHYNPLDAYVAYMESLV